VANPDIIHLLRRTEFTARPGRLATLDGASIAAAVDDVLDFAQNGNPQIPDSLVNHDSNNASAQKVAAYHWWLDSMATRPRPFQEKLTLFWHGHFTSEWDMVNRTDHMTHQNQLYRTNAIGNLLPLTQAMAIEPAMLLYLSNGVNVKSAPNQNFAREFLELFTLGVGNYTEDDVVAVSQAWTGHNYNRDTHAYEFRPTKHDTTNKTLFGQLRNWDGPDVINEVLRDNPAKRLIAARLIAKKLWEFLAYPGPAEQIVADLAALFIANNLEIRPLVAAILNRPEFYSTQAKQGLVRTPTEWAVSLLVASGQPSAAVGLYDYADRMGQMVFEPPNVSGWRNNGAWLSTSALSGRAAVAKKVASLMRANGGYDNLYAMSAADAVDTVANVFGIAPLATTTRSSLIDALASERSASNGSNSKAVTNLLIMTMLTGEMNVG
jgi:uncharacterized protein (DUF1800 family)